MSMKLQSVSRKEILRIARGTAVCDVLMIGALLLLSLVGVGRFSPGRILLGAICGSAVAVANFALLCLTVQSAAQIQDQRRMRRRFQFSYNLRLILQAAWVVACYLIPQIHFVAGAAPILFPNLVIFYLQFRSKLVSPGTAAKASPPEDPEPPERLESFEV